MRVRSVFCRWWQGNGVEGVAGELGWFWLIGQTSWGWTEANALVPVTLVAEISNAPTSKGVARAVCGVRQGNGVKETEVERGMAGEWGQGNGVKETEGEMAGNGGGFGNGVRDFGYGVR